MISKMEQETPNHIHISQAIKLLLPREYIARCRQKRHWASKFLSGKESLNLEHDIFVFGNVAVKRIKEGINSYLISCVERIELIKVGTEVLSFKLKDNPPVRLRGALYIRVKGDNAKDEYQVGEEILLMHWRSPCGVLSPFELLPVAESPGLYVLHEESKKWLEELGYVPFAEIMDSPEEGAEISPQVQELEDGFYEHLRAMDPKTICGCQLRHSTEQYLFRQQHGSGKRESTRQAKTVLSSVLCHQRKRRLNHQRKSRKSRVLSFTEMTEG